MKFAFSIVFAGLLAVAYYFVDQSRNQPAAAGQNAEWKRTAVEPETAVRPDSYAAMMWNENDPKPEVRAPASEEQKKPLKKSVKGKRH